MDSGARHAIVSRMTTTRFVARAISAGLLAAAATAAVDRVLDPLVSDDQRCREKRVRDASPHRVAGPRAAEALTGRRLDDRGARAARLGFTVTYGVAWGLVYAAVRRRFPAMARFAGLPFAVPFFLACDGAIAPALGLSPTPVGIPWQLNAKELANHVAWTAAAEGVHRFAS